MRQSQEVDKQIKSDKSINSDYVWRHHFSSLVPLIPLILLVCHSSSKIILPPLDLPGFKALTINKNNVGSLQVTQLHPAIP